jgi:Domain of unknown function (DUF4048)
MILSNSMTTTMPNMGAMDEKSEFPRRGPPRLSKRLTLNFPILPPTSLADFQQSPSPKRSTPADSVWSSPQIPTIAAPPTDSSSFLTSLAAQERRVLELREELHKAEAELSNLKKQWTQYEAGRKKNELRHVERLQPLPAAQSPIVDGFLEDGATPAAALRASLENGTDRPVVRKSTQRVFSGSRHTRALSLLSPSATSHQAEISRPIEEALSPTVTTTDIHSRQLPLSRSSTLSSTEQNFGFGQTYKQLAGRRSMPPPAKDAIITSGKKVASDLREGLWTFFEDIRQATVGDEGINGMDTRSAGTGRAQIQKAEQPTGNGKTKEEVKPRKQSQTRQKGRASQVARNGTVTPSPGPKKDKSFWKEFGIETPSGKDKAADVHRGHEKLDGHEPLLEFDDSWDVWDSPVAPESSPKHGSNGAHMTQPPNSDEGLPWPELTKLTPSKLTRTVSDLMKEWEDPTSTPSNLPSGLDDSAVASPHL